MGYTNAVSHRGSFYFCHPPVSYHRIRGSTEYRPEGKIQSVRAGTGVRGPRRLIVRSSIVAPTPNGVLPGHLCQDSLWNSDVQD